MKKTGRQSQNIIDIRSDEKSRARAKTGVELSQKHLGQIYNLPLSKDVTRVSNSVVNQFKGLAKGPGMTKLKSPSSKSTDRFQKSGPAAKTPRVKKKGK